jgi:hypothetical protein
VKFPKNIEHGVRACVFALAALAAAADAAAQFGGGMPGSGGMPGGGGMRGGRGGGGDRNTAREQQRPAAAQPRADALEQTIEELRVDLKLQPVQMPAWESYAGKVRALAGDIARSRSQMPPGPETKLLQRIDRSVDEARNRLAAIEDVSDAAKALFAVLAPEQQLVADPRLATIVISLGNGAMARSPAGSPDGNQDRRKY